MTASVQAHARSTRRRTAALLEAAPAGATAGELAAAPGLHPNAVPGIAGG